MHTTQSLRSAHHFISNNPKGILLALMIAGALYGCLKSSTVAPEPPSSEIAPVSSGEGFLAEALDEIEAIAEWAGTHGPLNAKMLPKKRKLVLARTAADSVYVYGQLTTEGYGAVVTERHQYPKGFLLITVRKSHGATGGIIVTDTKKYISQFNFENDIPSQSNLTEVSTQGDTIVTRVLRNGLLETYTFRLPVISRTINDVTGAVTETRRFGEGGTIVSERRDGSGTLIQRSASSGLSDGSLVTRVDYPDTTWRSTRTLGQADGSILREVTSGRGI